MKFKLFLLLSLLLLVVSAGHGQTQLTIKKKSSMKILGMPEMPKIPGMKNPMDDMSRPSTVYIKGSRMRTDVLYKTKAYGAKDVTETTIVQCDKQRSVQFNSKANKYYVDSMVAPTSDTTKNSKKGGYVTVTGSVTDTGERVKLFGYDARHLKETITFTPSKNACMKDAMKIEIEGWYADIPEFSCPIQRKIQEFQMDNNCFDDVDFQIKGKRTGVALKEIRKMTTYGTNGMTIVTEEEATEILKTPLADSLFEPPAGYKPANTLKEVEDNSPEEPRSETRMTTPEKLSTGTSRPTFAPPTAGIERVVRPKNDTMIRIGIAKPKVTTPETKNNPDAASDIASAATLALLESLKSDRVEAIELTTDFAENECSEKGCDFILFANITQKRGGGGMFGKIVAMGAISVAGAFIPGVGGMIASTVASQVMGQTMGKVAKAKDEFTFDYKVTGKDKVVLTQAILKNKATKDGDDVLTPQIRQVSTTILAAIEKR